MTTPRSVTIDGVIDPAGDFVAQLELLNPHGGLTLRSARGSAAANLFKGPLPVVNASNSELAVACLNTTGPAPAPYLGQTEDFHRYQVEVTVRSAAGKYDAGERLARAIHFRTQRMPPAGYVAGLQQQSGPEYLGEDDNRSHQWRFFIELWWRG